MRSIGLIVILAFIIRTTSPASAAELVFNPNDLIADHELIAAQALTADDVQQFLNTHEGILKTYLAVDIDGRLKSASQIIKDAAERHRINPKTLVVMLQKEQGLLHNSSPTDRALAWATGYGLCDLCSEDDPALARHKGFAVQVDSAAGALRFFVDNTRTLSWLKQPGQTYTIDGVSVTPANLASATLYSYTPHIEGNFNFWRLWHTYFSKTYPDGLLLKAHGDPRVWLIRDGARHHIATWGILASRFDAEKIIEVAAADLALMPHGGEIRFPNYALVRAGSWTYLLVDEFKHPFINDEVMRALGFNPLEVEEVSAGDLAYYRDGAPLTAQTAYPHGALLKEKNTADIFYVHMGMKYKLVHPAIAHSRFPAHRMVTVKKGALDAYTEGASLLFNEGTLIAAKGDPKVYLISGGTRRWVTHEGIFKELGFAWKDVVWITPEAVETHPLGGPVEIVPQLERSLVLNDGT